jgi:hypothetical protein
VKGHRRIARPSIFDAKRDFDFHMSVFAGEPSTAHYEAVRASERRNMRKRIRTLIGRLRERDRIYDELHLIELDSLMTAEARSDVDLCRELHRSSFGDAVFQTVAASVCGSAVCSIARRAHSRSRDEAILI